MCSNPDLRDTTSASLKDCGSHSNTVCRTCTDLQRVCNSVSGEANTNVSGRHMCCPSRDGGRESGEEVK